MAKLRTAEKSQELLDYKEKKMPEHENCDKLKRC